jgi:hypothetical protein
MKYVTIHLSRTHQSWLYLIFSLVFVSGAGWLAFHYFAPATGEFGATPHPSEPWWLRLHGAAAFAFLFLFGTVVPNHVRRAWQLRRNRSSGVSFCSLNAVLILTGYALYYFGGEDSRAVISMTHWIVGLAFPLIVAWHVWAGYRSRHLRHAGPSHS